MTTSEPPAESLNRETLQKQLWKETAERLTRIDKEFADGFDFINKYNDTVSIFGSARPWTEENIYYKQFSPFCATVFNELHLI